jgi:histidine kinase
MKDGTVGRTRAGRKRQTSIRRAATTLFALSILLSLGLLSAYEAAVASYYRGEASFLTALLKPGPSLARSSLSSDGLFRQFNALLLRDPQAAIDPATLAALGAKAGNLIVAVRVGSQLVYSSRPLSGPALEDLPAFGFLEQAPPPDEESAGDHLYTLRQLDFQGPSGEEASFFILRPAADRNHRVPYTRQLGLIAALFLLAADGAVGLYFVLRVTSALKRLETAALRMASGDLETAVGAEWRFAELARVFGVIEDMRVRISLLLAKERAHESERRDLIANLSHDLRTPLSALRGYVDGLREGIADTPAKSERYLGVVSDKVDLLERMIGEIFLLSTLDGGEARIQRETLDLGAFLRAGIDELRLSIPSAKATLADLEVDPAQPARFPVLVDPDQLKRVVENLVDNAFRHGGRSPIDISFHLERSGGRAVLRVEDNGRGIPEAERAAVFERFYRGRAERPGGGAGLGLAIARRLVEANGGRIHAEAAASGGAAIVIDFPLEEAS